MRIAEVVRVLSVLSLSIAPMAADPLMAVRIVALHYPRLAQMAGVQGEVAILLTTGRDGKVHVAKITSGNGLLGGPSASVLKTWIFRPCDRDAGCTFTMKLRFVLQEPARDIAECVDTFEFNNSEEIVVTSQWAKAIVD